MRASQTSTSPSKELLAIGGRRGRGELEASSPPAAIEATGRRVRGSEIRSVPPASATTSRRPSRLSVSAVARPGRTVVAPTSQVRTVPSAPVVIRIRPRAAKSASKSRSLRPRSTSVWRRVAASNRRIAPSSATPAKSACRSGLTDAASMAKSLIRTVPAARPVGVSQQRSRPRASPATTTRPPCRGSPPRRRPPGRRGGAAAGSPGEIPDLDRAVQGWRSRAGCRRR